MGGYSLGIPSNQLANMAAALGFMLTPCVYDHVEQDAIVSEFIVSYLSEFNQRLPNEADEEKLCKRIAWEFGQHVTRFGAAIKHPAFQEEREWRLVSPMIQEPHPHLDFRGSPARVVPFFRFQLANQSFPDIAHSGGETLTVVVGPTSDASSSQTAVQFMLTSLVGGAAHGMSAMPYRNW